ncbi:ABC transporter transmembrane domain-containing protein [Maritimibacter alkaliphilus]|uniref:ABC transporter transmembrane domain-containing protein n=1 Tax=Maritimibacter alkaliphilus TaxID=404236 RepID=UPI001C97948F|nr:ABC transporter transmembrane domain-containing protein [Maritimibacter alkaliphilus]MBY6091942.1 ABC transporter ATP-binding protein [Maritimibacter alkaliphilus]
MLRLYSLIWRLTGPRQIFLIIVSFLIAGLAAAPLKFQQDIINMLTDGTGTVDRLLLNGAGMMSVILLSLGLKWVLGYSSGILGEDVIRTIRKRLLHSASEHEADPHHVSAGTLSTAISAEAEELGSFIGGAFSEPVMQIGTLVSVIGFVTATQPRLGLVALAMVLPQVLIVVFTQRQVNRLVGERVCTLRGATDKLTAELLEDVEEAVTADFDRIYGFRQKIFVWKLSTKFLLSTISGVATVTVILLGGWLVLEGRSDVGTLVAAVAALGRLQGPTSVLITFFRQLSVNRVKFDLLHSLMGPSRATQPIR